MNIDFFFVLLWVTLESCLQEVHLLWMKRQGTDLNCAPLSPFNLLQLKQLENLDGSSLSCFLHKSEAA